MILAGGLPGAGGELAAAAAVAVAIASRPGREGTAPRAVLFVEVGSRRARGPTMLASPAARELERALRDADLEAAARGHVTWLGLGEGPDWLERLGSALELAGEAGAAVVHVPPAQWREALEAKRPSPSAVLIRAELPAQRALAALTTVESLDAGLPIRIASRAPGRVAGRRALSGIDPGGETAIRSTRLADGLLRRLTRDCRPGAAAGRRRDPGVAGLHPGARRLRGRGDRQVADPARRGSGRALRRPLDARRFRPPLRRPSTRGRLGQPAAPVEARVPAARGGGGGRGRAAERGCARAPTGRVPRCRLLRPSAGASGGHRLARSCRAAGAPGRRSRGGAGRVPGGDDGAGERPRDRQRGRLFGAARVPGRASRCGPTSPERSTAWPTRRRPTGSPWSSTRGFAPTPSRRRSLPPTPIRAGWRRPEPRCTAARPSSTSVHPRPTAGWRPTPRGSDSPAATPGSPGTTASSPARLRARRRAIWSDRRARRSAGTARRAPRRCRPSSRPGFASR